MQASGLRGLFRQGACAHIRLRGEVGMRSSIRSLLYCCASLLLLTQPVGCGNSFVRRSLGEFTIIATDPVGRNDRIYRQAAATVSHVCDTLQLPEPTDKLEIRCFASNRDYNRWVKRYYPDFAALDSCYIHHGRRHVVLTYDRPDLDRVLRHEVTHFILHSSIPQIPRWLDEGIAQYFELECSSPWRRSRRLAELREYLRSHRDGPDSSSLANAYELEDFGGPEYLQAWGWCCFMMDYSPRMRHRLLEALSLMQLGPGASEIATASMLDQMHSDQTLRQQFRDYYLR